MPLSMSIEKTRAFEAKVFQECPGTVGKGKQIVAATRSHQSGVPVWLVEGESRRFAHSVAAASRSGIVRATTEPPVSFGEETDIHTDM